MWHNPQSSPRVMRARLARFWRPSRLGGDNFLHPPGPGRLRDSPGAAPNSDMLRLQVAQYRRPGRYDLIRRVQSLRTRPHPWRRDHAHTMAVAKTKTSVHPLASDTTAAPGHRLTDANGKTDDDLRPSLLLPGGNP